MLIRILSLALIALAALAQEERFIAKVQPFTNHDLPAILKPYLPAPVKAIDGVLVSVIDRETDTETPDAVRVTLRWKVNGKSYRREQYAFLGTTGCAPEPCRWAPVVFDIGPGIDMSTVTATVEAVNWTTSEEE